MSLATAPQTTRRHRRQEETPQQVLERFRSMHPAILKQTVERGSYTDGRALSEAEKIYANSVVQEQKTRKYF